MHGMLTEIAAGGWLALNSAQNSVGSQRRASCGLLVSFSVQPSKSES